MEIIVWFDAPALAMGPTAHTILRLASLLAVKVLDWTIAENRPWFFPRMHALAVL